MLYKNFNDVEFKNFLYDNIQLQADDGISANVGKSAKLENLSQTMQDRLDDVVNELINLNIKSDFTQVYYQ